VIYPPKQCTFTPENNIIIGNVALYGATSGDLFVRGVAGERFAVRNSGAHAVVEAIGDHGCEYMTGGRVVIIGATGRNFAAGMSGGIAYVLDQNQTFKGRCNLGMVDLETIADDDDLLLQHLLARHGELTGSTVAQELLTQWNETRSQFVKVMPRDYKRVLQAEATARAESREPEFSELIGAQ
jgi:glutamate synthase domain-containing protein 3